MVSVVRRLPSYVRLCAVEEVSPGFRPNSEEVVGSISAGFGSPVWVGCSLLSWRYRPTVARNGSADLCLVFIRGHHTRFPSAAAGCWLRLRASACNTIRELASRRLLVVVGPGCVSPRGCLGRLLDLSGCFASAFWLPSVFARRLAGLVGAGG